MSYDIGIGDCALNYTSNVAALFYHHIPPGDVLDRGGLHTLYGLTGKQALSVLAEAFESISNTYIDLGKTSFRSTYDAPNGWGSSDGALIFLARLMAACAQNPRKKVWLCA